MKWWENAYLISVRVPHNLEKEPQILWLVSTWDGQVIKIRCSLRSHRNTRI